jgi:hypothetical protein
LKNRLSSILIVISITFLGIFFLIKSDQNNRSILGATIVQLINDYDQGKTDCIDFDEINFINWDRLYIFAPYSTPEKIESTIKTIWFGSRFTHIENSDVITLLVFTRNGNVVQYIEFWRGDGDFANSENVDGYFKSNLCFTKNSRDQIIPKN